jgi:RNA-directed DNA polymerase
VRVARRYAKSSEPLQLAPNQLKIHPRSPSEPHIFLHYALDMCLVREFPAIPFERYADDGILYCKSETQAQMVRDAINERLAQVGLELNLDKTRIVYCKDSNRKGSHEHEHEQFTFLGYTFRPRLARNKAGVKFISFLPAVSDDVAKRLRRTIKRWRLHLWSGRNLADLAREINSTVRGWVDFYGRFYRTELIQTLKLINDYLAGGSRAALWRARRGPDEADPSLAGRLRGFRLAASSGIRYHPDLRWIQA